MKLVTLRVCNLNSFDCAKLKTGLLFHYCFSSLWSFSIFFWSHRCNAHNLHPCSFSYPPIESKCQLFSFITVPSARSALIRWSQRRSFLSVRPHISAFELYDGLFLPKFIPYLQDLRYVVTLLNCRLIGRSCFEYLPWHDYPHWCFRGFSDIFL